MDIKLAINKFNENRGDMDFVSPIIAPLAVEMQRHLPEGTTYEISGPYGMGSRVTIIFNIPDKEPRIVSFRPHYDVIGRLSIKMVDYFHNLNIYPANSYGEAEGDNYPDLPIPETVEDIIKYMEKIASSKMRINILEPTGIKYFEWNNRGSHQDRLTTIIRKHMSKFKPVTGRGLAAKHEAESKLTTAIVLDLTDELSKLSPNGSTVEVIKLNTVFDEFLLKITTLTGKGSVHLKVLNDGDELLFTYVHYDVDSISKIIASGLEKNVKTETYPLPFDFVDILNVAMGYGEIPGMNNHLEVAFGTKIR